MIKENIFKLVLECLKNNDSDSASLENLQKSQEIFSQDNVKKNDISTDQQEDILSLNLFLKVASVIVPISTVLFIAGQCITKPSITDDDFYA